MVNNRSVTQMTLYEGKEANKRTDSGKSTVVSQSLAEVQNEVSLTLE